MKPSIGAHVPTTATSHLQTLRQHLLELIEQATTSAPYPYQSPFFGRLVDDLPVALYVYDMVAKHTIYANRECLALLSYSLHELQEMDTNPLAPLLHPDDRERVTACFACYATQYDDTIVEIEYRLRDRTGNWHWVLSRNVVLIRSPDGLPQQILGTIQDITATKQIEEEYERFFALSLDLLCIASFDGYFKRLSSAWERTLGFSQQELCAAPFLSFVHPDDEAATRIVWQKLADGQAIQGFENRFRCKDGGYRWLSWSATVLPHQQRLYAIARDITTQKTMLARLSYETHYDTLTGLPNRTFILEQLLQMAVPTAGSGFRLCAVLFVDLDSFKMINNGMGHVIGDQVLIAVSRRLKASLPPNSILTRFGADEFVILLPVLDTHMEALAVAERVHQCLQQPVLLEGWEIFLSASIGVAFNAPDMQHPNELLRNADTALHRAKMQGKRCTEIFDMLMHQQVTAQLQIANELQYILSRQELVLHYQPIVNLATGQIAGFEALVRWQHPRRGLLHPDAFLDVADEMGLVVALDYWVLRTACRQVRQWQQQLAAHSRLAINVNLSAKALQYPTFLAQLDAVLEETGLDSSCLHLELTEGTLLPSSERVQQVLAALHARQVHVHLDDFGTGYSSLSYLHHFPIQTLKIDRSFVVGLGTPQSDEVVRAIILLAHNLGMQVIAEGVETAPQLERLQELECDYVQGFHFGRPVATEAAGALLRQSWKHRLAPEQWIAETWVHGMGYPGL